MTLPVLSDRFYCASLRGTLPYSTCLARRSKVIRAGKTGVYREFEFCAPKKCALGGENAAKFPNLAPREYRHPPVGYGGRR